ncbi:MAG: class IV adenylate cyclase [Christensenellaceae bacterium]|jgi:adenylate cyclase class 2|nr:class IV adenylate cyclase [Christensenellaceae bacterium]
MLEVEIKASLAGVNVPALERRLLSLGFALAKTQEEQDAYYNGNDRDFYQTDEALRLRSVRGLSDSFSQTLLTYKGAKQGARSSAREELETSLGSFHVGVAILARLGYEQVLVVRKIRRSFVRQDAGGRITACLDEVEGLGSFLELEQLVEQEIHREAAVDRLLSVLLALQIAQTKLTRATYLEMLLHKRG